MLLQMTTNDAQNGSPAEGSFPATWQANPACNLWGFFEYFKQIFKRTQIKKKKGTTSCIPKIYSLTQAITPCRRSRMRPFCWGPANATAHNSISLTQGTSEMSPGLSLLLFRGLSWEKKKKNKQMNKIRSKQTTREENKPINPPEWLPWIIASQAGLNLLDVLVFESKEAFGTYLKLKWWAVKALAGTGISSAYVSALFLLLAPAPCLPKSRDRLGGGGGGWKQ